RSFPPSHLGSSVHRSLQRIEHAIELVDVRHLVQLRRYVRVPDHPVLVDYVERALAEAFLGPPNLVTPRHLSFGLEVGEQREGQTANCRPGPVAVHAANLDSRRRDGVLVELATLSLVETQLVAA